MVGSASCSGAVRVRGISVNVLVLGPFGVVKATFKTNFSSRNYREIRLPMQRPAGLPPAGPPRHAAASGSARPGEVGRPPDEATPELRTTLRSRSRFRRRASGEVRTPQSTLGAAASYAVFFPLAAGF